MTDIVPHIIMCKGFNVTAVRVRIEHKLNVETTATPIRNEWCVVFNAPTDVNLDFLRPDVIPPKED